MKNIKQKIYFIGLLIFTVITFIGAGYVISNGGVPNAGYAVIPMGIAVAFSSLFQFERNKNK